MKRKIMSILVASLMVVAMVAPISADGHQSITDIVAEQAAADPAEFTILAAALEEADLLDTLDGAGPFTVFAPTDEAFGNLLTALDITAAQLLGQPGLASVLLYHVIAAEVMSGDLVDGATPETVNGETVTVDLDGGVMINDANVTQADIEANNGVIHVIDKVLIPEGFTLAPDTVVDIATGNDDFSILVAALQKAELVSALQGEGPFTVFAPTNDAFADLLAALDITAEELLEQPDLANVLLYHVVSGKVMSADIPDQAETLNDGEMITFDLTGETPMVNDSGIIMTDLEAINGVVHVIDAVLVPENFELVDVSDEPEIPATGDNTPILIAGLFLTGSVLLIASRIQSVRVKAKAKR